MLIIKDGILVCPQCLKPLKPQQAQPAIGDVPTINVRCGCGYYTRMNTIGRYAVEFLLPEQSESPK